MKETPPDDRDLCLRIARLVEERGWNREEFARRAELHRLTVRSIFLGTVRRLHNATVQACARALGVAVHDLREKPLDRLLARMRHLQEDRGPGGIDIRRLYDEATQPELKAWLERYPDRAARLTEDDLDELLSLQGTGGPLTAFGVAHFVDLLERKRRLLERVAAVAGTEYLELLEQFVELLYDKVQPYPDRGTEPPADGRRPPAQGTSLP